MIHWARIFETKIDLTESFDKSFYKKWHIDTNLRHLIFKRYCVPVRTSLGVQCYDRSLFLVACMNAFERFKTVFI